MSDFLTDRLLHKILTLDEAAAHAERHRAAGRTIVSSNGCFDILHWGHIRYLTDARGLGDLLFVGINSDISVRKLKGPTRPVFPEGVRLRQLAGLFAVDFVCTFEDTDPVRFLEAIRPSIHAKGADYADKTIPETAVMKKWGGVVRYLPLETGLSTSKILALS